MPLSTYHFLLIVNGAFLTAAYVMERGSTPLTNVKYCEQLVSQLNARYKANILHEKCTSIVDACDKRARYIDPSELQCHDLVTLVKERGVQVDTAICLSNYRIPTNLEANTQTLERLCNKVVEKLRPIQSGLDPLICTKLSIDQMAAEIDNVDISGLSCHDLVKIAHKLGLKLSSSICRGTVVGLNQAEISASNRYSGYAENENGDSVCPNLASRLHDLGYKVDMHACFKIKIVSGPSREVINSMTCEEVIAQAKALRIIRGETNICHKNSLASENSRGLERAKHTACEALKVRLHAIGIDVEVDICSNLKTVSKLASEDIDKMDCPDIVAHARALHIIKTERNICPDRILEN